MTAINLLNLTAFHQYTLRQSGQTLATSTDGTGLLIQQALRMSSDPEITIERDGKVVVRIFDGQVSYIR